MKSSNLLAKVFSRSICGSSSSKSANITQITPISTTKPEPEKMAPQGNNYTYDQAVIKARAVDRPIHPIIHSRRSQYKMTGRPIDDETLFSLFEAARWSPSCYNTQNWRFVYGKRVTPHWAPLFDSLMDLNQAWVKNASAIIVVLSKKSFIYHGNTVPQAWNSFDAGAAWMSMALEASARGLVAHCMGGYHKEKVEKAVGIEGLDEFQVEAVVAVGYPAPEAGDEPVSQRLSLDTFVAEGKFNEKFNHTEAR